MAQGLHPLQVRRTWCRKTLSAGNTLKTARYGSSLKGALVSSTAFDLDQLIPHRDGMRLIDRLVAVNRREAVAEATPTHRWPLQQAGHVSSLVAVEISAQTAGILVGYQERQRKGKTLYGKGWLVGIKNAAFHQRRFRIGRTIRVHARPVFRYQKFHEVETEVLVDRTPAAHVVLQVFWTETGISRR